MIKAKESSDRRLFQRFTSRFPARFKDTREGYGQNVYLRDASALGARFTTTEHFLLNDNVFLEVELPDGKNPMNLKGQVVWVRGKEKNVWDIGLKFHKISLMHISRLYKFATE